MFNKTNNTDSVKTTVTVIGNSLTTNISLPFLSAQFPFLTNRFVSKLDWIFEIGTVTRMAL